MRKKLGEVLLERKLITPAQLSEALNLQRRRGIRLGAALVQCGFIDETNLIAILSDLLGIAVVDLTKVDPDPHAVEMVKHNFAAENDLFPYAQRWERGRTHLTVAMSDPLNYRIIDELSFITNATIEPVLARPSDVDAAIRRHYGARLIRTGDLSPVRLDSTPDETMTVVRRGGGEETINTSTGDIVSPFIKKAPEPEVPILPPEVFSQKDSAIVLTDEVSSEAKVDAVNQPLPRVPSVPIPLTDVKHRPTTGRDADTDPSFNEALGVLIDAAGGAVSAESFVALERKFWALMRILAKKGILTAQDFQRELGETDLR
jgi:hypothetical protein